MSQISPEHPSSSPHKGLPRGVVVVVVLVTVVVAAGGGGLLLASGDDDRPNGTDARPEDVVAALVAAAGDRDCEEMVGLFTDDLLGGGTREEAVALCEEEIEGMVETFADLEPSGPAEVEGHGAAVPIENNGEDETAIAAVQLVQVDGVWRIEGFDHTSGPSPEAVDADEGEVENVVSEYIAASAAGDCAAAVDLTSGGAWQGPSREEAIAECERTQTPGPWGSATVIDGMVSVAGDTATSRVALEGTILEISLSREHDVWLVADVQPA